MTNVMVDWNPESWLENLWKRKENGSNFKCLPLILTFFSFKERERRPSDLFTTPSTVYPTSSTKWSVVHCITYSAQVHPYSSNTFIFFVVVVVVHFLETVPPGGLMAKLRWSILLWVIYFGRKSLRTDLSTLWWLFLPPKSDEPYYNFERGVWHIVVWLMMMLDVIGKLWMMVVDQKESSVLLI